MAFQSGVNFRFTSGFPGQVIRDVPSVVKTWRLTAQTAQANTMGKAFTYAGEIAAASGLQSIALAQVGLFQAGAKFAGILCYPESLALYGTSAGGPLAPSLDVPPYEVVQLITKGEVVVNFTTAVTWGDPVYSDDVTGVLYNAALAGRTLIPNAMVVNTTTAAGPTNISLG